MLTRSTRRLPFGAMVALAAGLSLAHGGCSLVLDFEPIDQGDSGIDAGPLCDAFESNNSPAAASGGPGNRSADAAICGRGDVDFFEFTSLGGLDLLVALTMPDGTGDSSGDLGIRLFRDGDSDAIAISNSRGDTEIIRRTQSDGNQIPSGTYQVEVFPTNDGNENEYNLALTLGQ